MWRGAGRVSRRRAPAAPGAAVTLLHGRECGQPRRIAASHHPPFRPLGGMTACHTLCGLPWSLSDQRPPSAASLNLRSQPWPRQLQSIPKQLSTTLTEHCASTQILRCSFFVLPRSEGRATHAVAAHARQNPAIDE